MLRASEVRISEQIHRTNQEFAVKNIWHLIKDDAEVCKYLPSDEINDRWAMSTRILLKAVSPT